VFLLQQRRDIQLSVTLFQFYTAIIFSTYDSDNDHNTLNCAVKLGNGFWFGDINGACTTCNPNGILINSQYNKRINIDDEVFWDDMAIWSPWHVQILLERRYKLYCV